MIEYNSIDNARIRKGIPSKKKYKPPLMQFYGKLNRLTQGSGGMGNDANGTMTMHSDRNTKENIIKIGIHSLGLGVYLFNYKPEHKNTWGHGRKFGVMADEVEAVMPEAVCVHSDGYKMVNYDMLGITLGI